MGGPLLSVAARKPWAHYNWVEIYLVLFPFNERVFAALKLAGGHTAKCSPTCTQCTAYCTQGDAHVADPAKVPAPRWSPMLKVNRATGLDEISAEAMRFIRSHDHLMNLSSSLIHNALEQGRKCGRQRCAAHAADVDASDGGTHCGDGPRRHVARARLEQA